MKKMFVAMAVLALALALVACGPKPELSVNSDGTTIHAKATNGAEGTAMSDMKVTQGYGICINQLVDKGSFEVVIKDSAGKQVYEGTLDARIAQLVDVEPGSYDFTITARSATGTLDIIPYDKTAQAQADIALADTVEKATGKTTEELGIANPWHEVTTAEEAAQGAGVGTFAVIDGVTLSGGTVGPWHYQYMKNVAQASAELGETDRVLVRKSVGLEGTELSGDYTDYAISWTQNIKGLTVDCSGDEEGKANVVTWAVEDHAYCIVGPGLTESDINSLVNGIQ